MTPSRLARRSRALVAVAAVSSLALGACTGDEDAPAAQDMERKTQIEGEPITSPLTGMPLDAQPERPVIAVKIDNSSSSAPQVGLGSADMVVEELVEGGITRLATFFYTDVPRTVGPVRSMRATDIGVVKPLQAVLVASGGAPPTVRRVRNHDIRTVTEGGTGYYRDGARSAPYNLFMRLRALASTLEPPQGDVPTYLPFDAEPELPQGKPARRLTTTFSARRSTSFAFQQGRYVNTDSYAAAGDRFAADTVLALEVRIGYAGYLDPSGAQVPVSQFTGKGRATVFHDGRMVRGTWSKRGLGGTVALESGGEDLQLPPGQVWVALIPAEDGRVTVGR